MSFAERSGRALADLELRRSLFSATDLLYRLRKDRFAEHGADGDAYRRRARAIREGTIARLADHVERFVDRASRAGAQLHFAADAAEARSIVLDIARRSGAKRAVKMKSMLTEEIHLREALDAAGVQTIETDLGEWILQLARETPSHLIAPALHKSKAQVKRLFDLHLGADASEDAPALVERAQRALRGYFVEADLGITGCNFAVAETGTLVLVSNEGNGRLVTSGPPVHVALVPVEKLVPTLDEAATLVKMLIHSATGQRLTTYVSWLTGPRKAGELDGPRELHVVLVDNGRSAVLGGALEEALYCLRCGACLNACPVYRRVGGHAYESVYSGPIGIAVTPIVGLGHDVDSVAHASSLCGACEEVCPVRIDVPRLIVETRKAAARRASWLERFAGRLFAACARRPWLFRAAQWLLWLGGWFVARRGRIERMPGLSAWTRTRSLPAPRRDTFRARFSRRRARGA